MNLILPCPYTIGYIYVKYKRWATIPYPYCLQGWDMPTLEYLGGYKLTEEYFWARDIPNTEMLLREK